MGIRIGTVAVSWYGLFIVIGILTGMILGYILLRGTRLRYDDFIQSACFVGLGAMAGAKILYFIVSWESIDFPRLVDPEYLRRLMGGGFVFYGGLLGGILGLLLCGKLLRIPVLALAGETIPVIPLAHGFGRIGCAFAGCCYGVPYNGPGAVVYKESVAAPLNTPLFPVQMTEAVGEFLITAVLCVYIFYCRKHKRRMHSVELYLGMYAILRFLLEYVRYDDSERGIFLGISTSQWISAGILMLILVLYIWRRKSQKN